MVKGFRYLGLTAGCLALAVFGVGASAQSPQAKQLEQIKTILRFQPQKDIAQQYKIDYSVPDASEIAKCDAAVIGGVKKGSSGYLLKDSTGRPLRRFFDNDGNRHLDEWSYYKNGLEVYREIDTNGNNKPDQFRWFNYGGMKWGIDINEDGRIDNWRAISADEAAEEAFQAMITRDFTRLKALMVSESELQTLGLPESFKARIRAKLKQSPTLFQKTIAELPNLAGQQVEGRVEAAVPHCVPGNSLGAARDFYRHPNRVVLFQTGEKEHEWLNTGEMIQVGLAWRMLDVPYLRKSVEDKLDPVLKELYDQLAEHDSNKMLFQPGVNPAVERCNMDRVKIVEQILARDSADKRTGWLKQIADNLAAASMANGKEGNPHIGRLQQYRDQMAKQSPHSKVAGYFTFRTLSAIYTPKMNPETNKGGTKAVIEAQAEWLEKLAEFVQSYPTADDTPDALFQLAMGSEFNGKEDEAKRYYQQLATNFPNHMFAPKAAGAVRRLNLVGTAMELTGKTLNNTNFDIKGLRGKAVVVLYWATYCSNCPDMFARLSRLRKEYGPKGFEVVTVNLDDQASSAGNFLTQNPLPGYHVYHFSEGDGLSSPLANYYGIIGLPSMFVVGKDGRVIDRAIQINDLEDAIKGALK